MVPEKVSSRIWPLLTALLVTSPGLYFLLPATCSASYSPFGRDQGIFQYFAWALRQGDVLYRDIRDVNGPLTTFVHLVFQLFGGEDEHRFRVLDLVVTGGVFAFVGACLPGLGKKSPTKLERAAWAAASWAMCSASYLSYLYWDITQRETFANWFLLASVGLQFLAASRTTAQARSAWVLTFAAGVLSITTWFGKPTFVFFFPAQVLALWWDDEAPLARRKRFVSFALGAAAGAAIHLSLVAIYGDLRSFVRIAIFDAPVLYRYIWARTIPELFAETWISTETALALAGMLVLVGLILRRNVPRRALVVALLPLGALANLIAQRKGFMYHYQPLGTAMRLVWLVILVWLSERISRSTLQQIAPALALGLTMGLATARQAQSSPHTAVAPALWQHVHASRERETEDYFALWPEPHFYPWEMRLAAQYIQQHTTKDERIQVYGLDPYFLFLARRLSTTPYVYAYDLNVRAALAGGSGAKPDGPAQQRILAMQREHARDLESRVKARPPGAFVFIEHAPMTSYWDDGPRDFAEWCPDAAEWMHERYREAVRFGVVRVFLPANEAEGSSEQGVLRTLP